MALALLGSLAAGSAFAQSVIELQRREAHEFRQEMLEEGSKHRPGGGNGDDVFARMVGAMLLEWVKKRHGRALPTIYVKNVDDCVRDAERDGARHSLRGHPMERHVVMPRNERWIVLISYRDREKAIAAGCLAALTNSSMQVFEQRDGSYAVTYGTWPLRSLERKLRLEQQRGNLPETATATRGEEFGDRIWAAPDIIQNQIARYGR